MKRVCVVWETRQLPDPFDPHPGWYVIFLGSDGRTETEYWLLLPQWVTSANSARTAAGDALRKWPRYQFGARHYPHPIAVVYHAGQPRLVAEQLTTPEVVIRD